MIIPKSYIEWIRYSINPESGIPSGVPEGGWEGLFSFVCQQGIAGIVFNGVTRAEASLPKDVLFKWFSLSERIKKQNYLLNQRTAEMSSFFSKHGYKSIILKGQANATMYPDALIRTPGDIDIWVDAKMSDIINFVRKIYPSSHYSLHHIKFPYYKDTSVEVHYRPIYLKNWWADKRFQLYVDKNKKRFFENKIAVGDSTVSALTTNFNFVYQILHMYAHLFTTRNNFKQYIDYYYLLKQMHTETDYVQTNALFKSLHVGKFAAGVVWILHHELGLDEQYLITPTNEKVGRMLLKETMRYKSFSKNKLLSIAEQFIGNIRMIRFFPGQIILSPVFLPWHQWWKYKTKKQLMEI